jgi:hypothetical protein
MAAMTKKTQAMTDYDKETARLGRYLGRLTTLKPWPGGSTVAAKPILSLRMYSHRTGAGADRICPGDGVVMAATSSELTLHAARLTETGESTLLSANQQKIMSRLL